VHPGSIPGVASKVPVKSLHAEWPASLRNSLIFYMFDRFALNEGALGVGNRRAALCALTGALPFCAKT
jgi:hypothetical protein